MADAEQRVGIVITAKDEATPELKKTQKTLQDFSETAFKAAEQLSATFGKKNIDQAQKMANVLRSFNQNNQLDTKGGLDSLLNAKEIKDVGSALAQLTGTQASSLVGMVEAPKKELQDYTDLAKEAREYIDILFGKEDVDKARELAETFRQFDSSLSRDTEKGLTGVLNADNVEELGRAFASLTNSQLSALTKGMAEPVKETVNLTDNARLAASHISALFSEEQVKKAKKLAETIREFNQNLKPDTLAGLGGIMSAENVEELGQAFARLTSSETAKITSLFEKPQEKLTLLSRAFNNFTQRAQSSLRSMRRFLDRIGNIIVYRLIRQGMSLLVNQMREGTKSIYLWARAFKNADPNNIAETLDTISTKFDAIRGNLGAAWATFLSSFSDVFVPLLDRVSEAISKITALTSAVNGNATYFKVAADNVKRYYDTVASGLQDIKVLGSQTRYEEALVDPETKLMGDKVRENLGELGAIAAGVSTGVGLILIATGHVVAGMTLAGAAFGISKLTNDLDGTNTTSNKVKEVFSGIGSLVNTIELGLGIALLSQGQWKFGIPLVVAGGSGILKKLGDVDINSDLSKAFSGISLAIDTISLGLGAVLCAYGQYGLGVPLLVTGLVGITEATMTNWDDIMDSFKELGLKIKVWWWNLWNGDIYSTWEEQFDAYVKAHLDEFPIGNETLNFGATQMPGLGGYSPLNGNDLTVGEEEKSFWKSAGEVFSNIGDKIGKFFSRSVEGYKLRYGLTEFADGGFPSAGSLFIAGEVPGQTELLGTINGRTGVAGGAEITGIREAIYEVGAEILNGMAQNRPIVNIEGDADRMFQVVREKSRDYTRRTGEFAF